MNLEKADYARLIRSRTERLGDAAWGGGATPPAAAVQEDDVPDFELMKRLHRELGELVAEFETSLGPA